MFNTLGKKVSEHPGGGGGYSHCRNYLEGSVKPAGRFMVVTFNFLWNICTRMSKTTLQNIIAFPSNFIPLISNVEFLGTKISMHSPFAESWMHARVERASHVASIHCLQYSHKCSNSGQHEHIER